jgi:hypothetical protein
VVLTRSVVAVRVAAVLTRSAAAVRAVVVPTRSAVPARPIRSAVVEPSRRSRNTSALASCFSGDSLSLGVHPGPPLDLKAVKL